MFVSWLVWHATRPTCREVGVMELRHLLNCTLVAFSHLSGDWCQPDSWSTYRTQCRGYVRDFSRTSGAARLFSQSKRPSRFHSGTARPLKYFSRDKGFHTQFSGGGRIWAGLTSQYIRSLQQPANFLSPPHHHLKVIGKTVCSETASGSYLPIHSPGLETTETRI